MTNIPADEVHDALLSPQLSLFLFQFSDYAGTGRPPRPKEKVALMTTLTFPLSRIEGHARVEIEVHDGEVISTRFQAMEKRGFTLMVQGVPAEQIPVIVPRICGVCSTAHYVASVKALEDAYGVQPPPLADTIRELLLLGADHPEPGDLLVRFHHAGPSGCGEHISHYWRRGECGCTI